MRRFATIRVALRALWVHKGRSFLTSLGIVIGIGSVIAMVSAGEGVAEKLDESMETVGKNIILIRPGARSRAGAIADATPLTHDDAALIRKQVGPLLTGVAEVQVTQRRVASDAAVWTTLVTGTVPELQTVRDWKLTSGRYFTREETAEAANVCVIGQTVRSKLFPNDPTPLGKAVRIDDRLRLRVIGVLASKGRNPAGADQDDELFTPITTLQRKLVGEERISAILATARSDAVLGQAHDEIVRAMRQAHRVASGAEDFDVSTVQEMAEVAYVITGAVQALVAVIASLSLLVGGIGIMNIMLVSVTERTREIGLRMAVGATSGHILTQFLTEAVVLSVLGGVLGVATGLGAAAAVAKGLGWPIIISPVIVALAVGVSAGVGVFFGFYPAWKASRLDPIEALRYE
jgi:putative ABC transport system permease protein